MMIDVRRIVNVIAVGLMIVGYFVIFFQVYPIPYSMAQGMPKGLFCTFYTATRTSGWGCSRLGDVLSQPLPTVLALCITTIAVFALWTKNGPFAGNPLPILIAFQSAFPFGTGTILRLVYFVQGHASTTYAIWTLLPASIVIGSFLVIWLFRNPKTSLSLRDIERREMERRTKVRRAAAIEIAERLSELNNAKKKNQ
jgi:hypothetical protein